MQEAEDADRVKLSVIMTLQDRYIIVARAGHGCRRDAPAQHTTSTSCASSWGASSIKLPNTMSQPTAGPIQAAAVMSWGLQGAPGCAPASLHPDKSSMLSPQCPW